MSVHPIIIGLSHQIKKRVNNLFAYKGRVVRNYSAVLDKITRQLIFYNIISIFITVLHLTLLSVKQLHRKHIRIFYIDKPSYSSTLDTLLLDLTVNLPTNQKAEKFI